jgi:hypothetical protein
LEYSKQLLKVLHDDLGMKKILHVGFQGFLRRAKIVRKEVSQKDLIALTSVFLQIVPGVRVWCIIGTLYQTRIEALVHKSLPPPNRVVGRNNHGNYFFGTRKEFCLLNVVKGTTINGKVYLKTIQSFKEALILKLSLSWRQKDLLLHDNCKVRKARNVHAVIPKCGFTELRHPPYSPDLAPCDFFWFKNVETNLGA